MWDIRPVVVDDLERVIKLLQECNLPVEGLQEYFGDSYCVAVSDGEIIGAGGVEVHGAFGLLRSVAVRPPWQGNFIGSAIVQNRIVWAKCSGISDVYLLTTTAKKFFEQSGFCSVKRNTVPEKIKQCSEFSSICPESAVVMKLSLRDWTPSLKFMTGYKWQI